MDINNDLLLSELNLKPLIFLKSKFKCWKKPKLIDLIKNIKYNKNMFKKKFIKR